METQDARSLSPDARFDLRTRVVAAVRGGMSRAEAARVFGGHRSAVSRWCQAADPDALRPRRPGRTPTGRPLRPGPEAEPRDPTRTRHPDDPGGTDALWARDAVAEYAAARLGARRSRYVRGRWLRRRGFTPRRPARRASQQDPAGLARWRAEVHPGIRAEAGRAGAEVRRLDETGPRTDHNPGTGYAPRGRPPVARVGGGPHRVHVVSTLTNAGVLRFGVFAGRFTAAVLVGFLGRRLRGTAGPVFLVPDGPPVHRGRRAREWAAAPGGRLRPFVLRPYRPELNPTEYLNSAVKGTCPGSGGRGPGRSWPTRSGPTCGWSSSGRDRPGGSSRPDPSRMPHNRVSLLYRPG
jgi:transposase